MRLLLNKHIEPKEDRIIKVALNDFNNEDLLIPKI